jgi:phosphoadenosine phosphosulfate reductase
MPKKSKRLKKKLEEENINFLKTMRGGVVLNTDNDDSRRAVEFCYRTWKTLVNPIIDWDDAEVWEYLNEWINVPHCSLYDEGFKRIGCIGCPMGGRTQMLKEFARWPKYKQAYIRACERSCEHLTDSKVKVLETYQGETDGEKVFNWWIQEPMKKD